MKVININVMSAVDTSSQNGSQVDSGQLYQATFQAVFADSSAAGTLKIQMSNDIPPVSYEPGIFTVSNWTDIPNATATVASGASAVVVLSTVSCRWLRAVYTRSSGGSSTINVIMFAISI